MARNIFVLSLTFDTLKISATIYNSARLKIKGARDDEKMFIKTV